MPLESGDYIADLNVANPVGSSDLISQGDDHLRLIKKCVQQSLPNITGAVTATHTDLNVIASASPGTLPAVNGSAVTNLNASALASGTVADGRLSSNVALYNASMASFSSGTLPDARLSSNVAKLDATNAFTGTVTFNGVNVTDYARLSQGATFAGDLVVRKNGFSKITLGTTASNPEDAAAVDFVEGSGSFGTSGVFGWRIKLNGDTNELLIQSGNGTTVTTRMAFPRDSDVVTVGSSSLAVGYRDLPTYSSGPIGGKVQRLTSGTTLATGQATGTTWVIYNNSGSAITLTQGSGLTLRLGGTTTTGNRTLLPRGFATVYAVSTTEYVVTGHVT